MNAEPRDGMVLPLALVAIVILGVAVASGSFLERADAGAARRAYLHASATGASEAGALAALAELRSAPPYDLAIGASRSRSYRDAHPLLRTTVSVTRLGETVFALRGVVEAAESPASAGDETRLLVRLDPLDPPATAAITTRRPPQLGAAVVDGRDAPGSGDCPPAASDDVPTAPVADSSTVDSIHAMLRARAGKRYPAASVAIDLRPAVTDGRCDPARQDNWGDPSATGPCASYRPVIHAEGDLTVDGGTGQGILLVDGDLQLGGGFKFDGLIIVHGELAIVGTGATLTGGVVAGDADLSPAEFPATIRRSSCTVRRALLAAAPLVPLVERPWASIR
jgi:hypothetical protein